MYYLLYNNLYKFHFFLIKMQLRSHLREILANSLAELDTQTAQTQMALRLLETAKPGRMTYSISIKSFWEGEQQVSITYSGSLRRAIESAESQFMRVNRRGDVQAAYSVGVVLGEITCPIPEELFRRYKKKH